MRESVLDLDDVHVQFATPEATVRAVDGVSLQVGPGETVGIVGESGSGKTMLALSILRLLPEPGRVTAGRIVLQGRDVLALADEEMRRLRGRVVSMTFQDPMTALNPVLTVSEQVTEALTAHRSLSRGAALKEIVPLMTQVRVADFRRRLNDHPHQFSGGMRQRILIAMGIANQPSLLIADEATTALDVTSQAQMIHLLGRLNTDLGLALVVITHNIAVVRGLCQRLVVMYAGRIVEEGPVEQIFDHPQHPYTWALLRAAPRLDLPRGQRLVSVAGRPPDLGHLPSGCTFHPRCAFAEARCATEEPPVETVAVEQRARCWVLMRTISTARIEAALSPAGGPPAGKRVPATEPSSRGDQAPVMLAADGVVMHFMLGGSRGDVVRAVDGVSLSIRRGETLGLIGESGCGKSTLGRVLAGLIPPTSGRVAFEGHDLAQLRGRQRREIRRRIQIVFQDPQASLDPRMSVGDIVAEPLHALEVGRRAGRRARAGELLDLVGLGGLHQRYPHQLSGGQRQRVGIARALAPDPQLIICDEPVSNLDVSIQAQIINLLVDLRHGLGLTLLFISHDLAVVRHIADRIAVMYLGRLVEVADAAAVYGEPLHPYTRALRESASALARAGSALTDHPLLEGELASPVAPPRGCRFHPRCPMAEVPGMCNSVEPNLRAHHEGRLAACHFASGTLPVAAGDAAPRSRSGSG